MTDFTPESIAAIATRLYNEAPAASAVPKTESEARDLPSTAATAPVGLIPPAEGMFSVPGVSEANADGLRIRAADPNGRPSFRDAALCGWKSPRLNATVFGRGFAGRAQGRPTDRGPSMCRRSAAIFRR